MTSLSDLGTAFRHPRTALAAVLLNDRSVVAVQNVFDLAHERAASNNGICDELEALHRYLGMPRTFLALAMANGAHLVASRWLREKPASPAEIMNFYATSWESLYHLAFSNLFPKYRSLLGLLRAESGGCCLCFGGGIGGEALALAAQGNDVWYQDLPESPVWKFAQWRSEQEGLDIHFSPEVPHDVVFDCVVAFNVFQLMPAKVLEDILHELVDVLKPGGRLYCNNDFDYLERNRDQLPRGPLWEALFSQHFNHKYLWERLVPKLGLHELNAQVYEKIPRQDGPGELRTRSKRVGSE